jgi:hypothetical protein
MQENSQTPRMSTAASRHSDGNIRKSIEINATRFGIPVELAEIFENTVDLLS